MNLPTRKAAIILYKDDAEGLKRTIDHISPYFNKIIVGYDGTEPTPHADTGKVCQAPIQAGLIGFAAARHKLDVYANDYQIHVHVDTDEVWDTAVLADLVKNVTKEKPCWRSPRCNMPDGHAYPDHQVRVFWYTPAMHWVGNVHEQLYDGDKPADQGKNIGTFKTPIVHLPRKNGINREWWKQS